MSTPISITSFLLVTALGVGLSCGAGACGERKATDRPWGATIQADPSPNDRHLPPPGAPSPVAAAPFQQTEMLVVAPPPAAGGQIASAPRPVAAAPQPAPAPVRVIVVEAPAPILCGPINCDVGQVCCNASCGVCTAPGEQCQQDVCITGPSSPVSLPCGLSTCEVGQVCCNAGCGLCAAPGVPCSSAMCGR